MHLLSRLERLLQMDTVSLDIRKSAPSYVSVAEEKVVSHYGGEDADNPICRM